jgi:hypothetical protein
MHESMGMLISQQIKRELGGRYKKWCQFEGLRAKTGFGGPTAEQVGEEIFGFACILEFEG